MTVLQSLDGYYGRMAARGEASLPGYSREKIDFVVVLSADGVPTSVRTLRRAVEGRMASQPLDVPAAVIRKSNIKPNLLWDKTAYSLGRTAGEGRRTADEHAAFKSGNLALLGETGDPGLLAFCRFLKSWSPDVFDHAPFSTDMLDANLVFALAGENNYLHDREAAQHLIASQSGPSAPARMCLVTGIASAPARLHKSIRGVQGAQTAGAALVSFNLDAFTSYGKSQGDNAPTSEAAAFRYVTALNRMLEREGSNRVRRTIGDATVVFWADVSNSVDEAAARRAEDFFADFADPPTDESEAVRLSDALRRVASGRALPSAALGLAPGTRFHVLGLSPNAARLSVRFWLSDTFDSLAGRLASHYAALAIEPPPWRDRLPSVSRLLVQTTALLEDFKNIPPLLAGEVMRSVLSGAPYPRTWLAAAIIRLRAGDDPGRGWHAAVIKAFLARTPSEETPPVSLDPDNPNPAYQLGRLFAVLEAAQYAALGNVNASIADRYYGAASATPARVFGTLLRGARGHIADAQRRNKGFWITPRLEQIIDRLPADLPRSLRLEDQGRFAVGYYHERAHRPAKSAAGIEPETVA